MNPLNYAISKAASIPYVKGQSRHFALVLDKRNRVVSEAANSYVKTSTVMKKAGQKAGYPCKEFLHSEILALSRDKYKKGVKLLVVRVDKNGVGVYSEPCPVCKLFIKTECPHIKSIEFSV